MKRKLSLISVWTAGLFVLGTMAYGRSTGDVRIYLPSEKTVLSETFNLGQIAVILGDDAVARIANKVSIGKFVTPGQKIVVDRKTILSRLASSGIKTKSVTFNGSERISVCQDEKSIGASRFLKVASAFLQEQVKDQGIQSLKLIRPPKDFLLSAGSDDIVLVPRMSTRQNSRTREVTVSVMQQGVELNRQEVVFAVQYTCHRLVASQDMAVGTLISTANTRVEEYASAVLSKEPLPYGFVTRRVIKSGASVRATMVEPKVGPVLVKRRQQVVVKFDTGLLYISAPGVAMQDGRVGEIISVQRGSRRTKDERIIMGKVMPDGSVEPVF